MEAVVSGRTTLILGLVVWSGACSDGGAITQDGAVSGSLVLNEVAIGSDHCAVVELKNGSFSPFQGGICYATYGIGCAPTFANCSVNVLGSPGGQPTSESMITIPPSGYLLLQEACNYSSGDSLCLYKAGALADSVTITPTLGASLFQSGGGAVGRIPDGTGTFQPESSPTLGKANHP
jgi:hypothetical protein